jgi:hypothetical protein
MHFGHNLGKLREERSPAGDYLISLAPSQLVSNRSSALPGAYVTWRRRVPQCTLRDYGIATGRSRVEERIEEYIGAESQPPPDYHGLVSRLLVLPGVAGLNYTRSLRGGDWRHANSFSPLCTLQT